MQKNSGDFSMQEAMGLVNSPAGRQLLALLQQSDTSALRTAMEQASAGNYTQAKDTLAPLLASEEVRALLQQLGGQMNG